MQKEKQPTSGVGRGGARPNSGRPKGSSNLRSRQLQEQFLAAVTDEKFQELFDIVFGIARDSEKDADRLRAAMYILERVLPKQVEVVEHTITDGMTVADVLGPGRYKKVDIDDNEFTE